MIGVFRYVFKKTGVFERRFFFEWCLCLKFFPVDGVKARRKEGEAFFLSQEMPAISAKDKERFRLFDHAGVLQESRRVTGAKKIQLVKA
jgi:hypothetical protein